jgi:hypothetical protein
VETAEEDEAERGGVGRGGGGGVKGGVGVLRVGMIEVWSRWT